MWHGLSRLWSIVDTDVVTVRAVFRVQVVLGRSYKIKHGLNFCLAQFKKRSDVPFWNDEGVSRRYGIAITNLHGQIVLIDDALWWHFAEWAALIGHSYFYSAWRLIP